MSEVFVLDARLANDCEIIAELDLSFLLLMKDENYPWFILVPKVTDVFELVDLDRKQQQQLLVESNLLSRFILDYFNAEKLNVAALGNVVKQLHIHHIGRFENDIAWPKPVWNVFPAKPYRTERVLEIKHAFDQFIQK